MIRIRQCFNLCVHEEGCVRAVFSLKSKNCVLKGENHGPKTTKKNSFSFAVKSPQCEDIRNRYNNYDFLDIDPEDMEKDRDYPGGKISAVKKVKNVSSCVKLCRENDDCVRVLVAPRQRSCILKNDKHEEGVYRNGVVSIALDWEEAEEGGACFTRNIDYPGGEIKRQTDVPGHSRCLSICKFTKKCVRIVWVPYENLCILKDETHGPATRQSAIANRDAISLSLKCRRKKRRKSDKKEKSEEGKQSIEKNDQRKKSEERQNKRRKSEKEKDNIDESKRGQNKNSDEEIEKRKNKEKEGESFVDLDEQEVLHSTTFKGGFIRKIKEAAKLSDCKKACVDDKDCFIVVANVKSKRCFLQSKQHGEPEKRKDFVSVMVRERKPKKPIIKFIDLDPSTLQMDVAYTGGTLETISDVEGLSDCTQACLLLPECILVVANVQMKRCFLRDAGHGNPVKRNGFVSVVVRQKKAEKKPIDRKKNGKVNEFIDISRNEMEIDTVYSDGLISSVKEASSLSQCKQTCLETQDCVRVVANVKTRKCFFRSSKARKPKARKGFVSLLVKSEQAEPTEERKTTPQKKVKQYKDKQNRNFLDVEEAELDTRYHGGLIITVDNQRALSDCVKLCSQQPDCIRVDAFVTLRRCALKNKSHDPKPTSQRGMVSVVVSKTSDTSDTSDKSGRVPVDTSEVKEWIDVDEEILELDTGYRAGFIAEKRVTKFSQCIKMCQETQGCVRADGVPRFQMCRLRNNQYGEGMKQLGKISYKIKRTQSSEDVNKDNKEFVDLENDKMQRDFAYSAGWISTIPKVQSMSECFNLCKKNEQCVIFTVVPKFKRCSLLNKNHGKGQRKLGFISMSMGGDEVVSDIQEEKRPKINYCTEVIANLDPKDRRSFVKQAKCSR